MLDCMETVEKNLVFHHQGEGAGAIQALVGKCVFLLLSKQSAM